MKKKIVGILLIFLGIIFTFAPAWILFGEKGLDVILCVLLFIFGFMTGVIGMMLIQIKEESQK